MGEIKRMRPLNERAAALDGEPGKRRQLQNNVNAYHTTFLLAGSSEIDADASALDGGAR
jgi:hypothetical protein